MSEHDLLDIAHQASQAIEVNLAQVLTITFAMVVAIYYFLHQAGLRMKIFVLYALGMLVYLGSMLAESMLVQGAIKSLDALKTKSDPTAYYLALNHSWVRIVTMVSLNGAYWILWIGIAYLMFFWKKPGER